jgi:hypothetical protein
MYWDITAALTCINYNIIYIYQGDVGTETVASHWLNDALWVILGRLSLAATVRFTNQKMASSWQSPGSALVGPSWIRWIPWIADTQTKLLPRIKGKTWNVVICFGWEFGWFSQVRRCVICHIMLYPHHLAFGISLCRYQVGQVIAEEISVMKLFNFLLLATLWQTWMWKSTIL